MPSSIQILIKICLFSANPQDLPESRHFLVGCIIAAVVVLLSGYNMLPTGTNPVALTAGHIVIIGVGWFILLKLTRKIDRWIQSASAVYGTTALINLILLPLIASSDRLGSPDLTTNPNLTIFAFLSLSIWEIAVTASIVRETIELPMHRAILISLFLTFMMQFLMATLF